MNVKTKIEYMAPTMTVVDVKSESSLLATSIEISVFEEDWTEDEYPTV